MGSSELGADACGSACGGVVPEAVGRGAEGRRKAVPRGEAGRGPLGSSSLAATSAMSTGKGRSEGRRNETDSRLESDVLERSSACGDGVVDGGARR